MGSLVGQPNHALSPPPVSTEEVTGVIVSNDVDHVWKMFQPPWAGGSFFARRATIVDQSIACRSTVAPIERRHLGGHERAAWAYGVSVGSRTTSGRPS
jgi:hypothetical protein